MYRSKIVKLNNSIKQDINFLDKPLWFLDCRNDELGIIWKDLDGYEYRCGYKIPDKIDMLILFYLMLKAQTANYQTEIEVSRREVLKGCNLPMRDNKYYERVEDSLKRWTNIAIEFHGTFYDNNKYLSMVFHIIETYKIDKETKLVKIRFSPDWLLKIKESQFFKYVSFEQYKHLKRPVSRRLFEILCTKFYGGDKWQIHVTKLGIKLGLSKRKVQTREGKKEVIYASDVLVAIKPAINEINRLATIPNIWEVFGIQKKDLFTITIEITGEGQERIIHFIRHLVYPEESQSKEISIQLSVAIPSEEEPGLKPEAKPSQTVNKINPVNKINQVTQVNRVNTADVALSAELQEQYRQGIEWLTQAVPQFNIDMLQEITKADFAEYFPKLKEKFEHETQKGKINNPGAYVMQCLRKKWERVKSQKEIQAEKSALARQEREAQEQQKRQLEKLKEHEIELKRRKLYDLVKENEASLTATAHDRWERAKGILINGKTPSKFQAKLTFTQLIAGELGMTTEGIDIHFLADMADIFKDNLKK